MSSPLLELEAFKISKEQLGAALSTKAVPVDMHPNVKHVLQNQQSLIVWQGEVISRMPGNRESAGQEYEEARSTAGPSYPPREPAPVSISASTPPEWIPVALQQLMLQGATQPSLTMMTTATTTTTTATTTTGLVVSNLKVNYRLQDVADICAEVQKYDQEIQKAGKIKVPSFKRKHQQQEACPQGTRIFGF
ncbi:unnamed protein product [Mortierella alpina]